MQVRIGHATNIENPDPMAGGPRAYTMPWRLHKKGWVLLRCRDADKRERIAEAMEKACANPSIAYNHRCRRSLYNNIRRSGFDPSQTTGPVCTDCSGLVRVCIAYAFGEDRTGNFVTKNQPERLAATGLFEILDDARYCASSDHLLRGDILCTPVKGHTVVVLDSGAKIETTRTGPESARCFAPGIAGTYVTTASLNVRSGAGVRANIYGQDKTVLIKLPRGVKLICLGGYTTVAGRRWLYVHFVRDGVTYTGFASSKYLRKIQS